MQGTELCIDDGAGRPFAIAYDPAQPGIVVIDGVRVTTDLLRQMLVQPDVDVPICFERTGDEVLGVRSRDELVGALRQSVHDHAEEVKVERAIAQEALAKLAEVRAVLREMAEWHGGTHESSCPVDDTCNCAYRAFNDRVNAACVEEEK